MGNIGHKILSHLIQAGQLLRHIIERLPQFSQLIPRLDFDSLLKLSLSDMAGNLIHFPQWGGNSFGKVVGK